MPRSLAAWVSLLALVSGSAAIAQSSATDTGLGLEQAVAKALSLNPGIRAAGFQVEVAAADRELAALPNQMSFGAEVENFLGTGETSAFDSADTTLQLTRVLDLGDKQSLRAGLGDARIRLAESEAAAARLALAAETARRFIRLVALQESLALAEQAVELADDTLAIVRRRVEVGRSSEAELATAEIESELARLDVAAIGRQVEAAGLALATLWGEEAGTGVEARADIHALPALPAIERLKARIADNPELLRSLDQRRILEAERSLARARGRADPELDFGLRYLAAPDDTALVFGVRLPLGSGDRAERALAVANAALLQVEADAEQRRLAVLSVLLGLHAEARTARERYTQLTATLLPRSEEAAALYRQGFELSGFSLLEFSQAQRHPLELRREALAAAERYHTTLVAIEQLLGGTYAEGASQ